MHHFQTITIMHVCVNKRAAPSAAYDRPEAPEITWETNQQHGPKKGHQTAKNRGLLLVQCITIVNSKWQYHMWPQAIHILLNILCKLKYCCRSTIISSWSNWSLKKGCESVNNLFIVFFLQIMQEIKCINDQIVKFDPTLKPFSIFKNITWTNNIDRNHIDYLRRHTKKFTHLIYQLDMVSQWINGHIIFT